MSKQSMYDPIIFCQRESLDMEEFIVATYLTNAVTKDILMRAGAVAVEQTTGTWCRVPDETDEVRRKHVGRVINVFNIPAYETSAPSNDRTFIVQVAFPWKNFGQQLPMMLSTVYGNISMTENLKLLDLEFPKKFTDGFAGPQFGVEGIKELCGAIDRPPVLAMIKPCVGASLEVTVRQFERLARAGIDYVKDDELIADPVHAPYYERLKLVLEVSDRVYEETGHRAIFVPNITDTQNKIYEKAERSIEMGARALMLNSHATGYGALGAIAANPNINVPLLSHPCYAGVGYAGAKTGMSSTLIFGKFMRLEGADMVVYPFSHGKVPQLQDRFVRAAQSMLSGFNGLKRSAPSPGAGVHPGLVPQMMDEIGEDVILAGGACMHAHPMGIEGGIKALHQAAEAWKADVSLEEYAKDHKELKASIDIWGVYDPDKSIFELTN